MVQSGPGSELHLRIQPCHAVRFVANAINIMANDNAAR